MVNVYESHDTLTFSDKRLLALYRLGSIAILPAQTGSQLLTCTVPFWDVVLITG